jgi:hypothetical protein
VFLLNPLLSLVWLPGLIWLLINRSARRFRLLGIIYIVIFLFLAIQQSKPYYLFPYYPVLFAAGAVFWEHITNRWGMRWIRYVIVSIIVVAGALTIPFGLPVLPQETLARYSSMLGPPVEASPDADDIPDVLPKHFADRHGWEQLAATVSEVYLSLPEEEKSKAVVFLGNYGQAAAIDYFRQFYPLPPAISGHNAYWFWGPGNATGEVVIHVGGAKEQYEQYYESSTLMREFSCRYCVPDQNKLGIFVSRQRRTPLSSDWDLVKHFD